MNVDIFMVHLGKSALEVVWGENQPHIRVQKVEKPLAIEY